MKKYYIMAIHYGDSDAIVSLKDYYMKNPNDLSVIDLYNDKHFNGEAKDIINNVFQNNLNLPEQYKQQFANLKFNDGIHKIVKTKQNILIKTNIWPSKYDSKYLKEFTELLTISTSNDRPFCKDIILYIAGCLFV